MPYSMESNRQDSGLICLVQLARLHHIAADPQQLMHERGASSDAFDVDDIVRAGKSIGLKIRSVSSDWQKLAHTPLPAICQHRDGHFLILAAIRDDQVLIQDPLESRPLTLPRELFEDAWTGRLVLVTRRASLKGLGGRFGFGWFIPAIVRHRKLFGEVLIASFFLQPVDHT